MEDIGYISFRTFTFGTGHKVVDAINRFKQLQIRNLILDLRGNSGGMDYEMLTIADALIPQKAEVF